MRNLHDEEIRVDLDPPDQPDAEELSPQEIVAEQSRIREHRAAMSRLRSEIDARHDHGPTHSAFCEMCDPMSDLGILEPFAPRICDRVEMNGSLFGVVTGVDTPTLNTLFSWPDKPVGIFSENQLDTPPPSDKMYFRLDIRSSKKRRK